jgi:hypothetical protein
MCAIVSAKARSIRVFADYDFLIIILIIYFKVFQ